MKLRALFLFGWTAWFAPAQEASCHPVEGDRISARDLAAALPEFRTAPPEALIGQTPLPGARRTFHAAELRALAHRFGVALSSPEDVCFEWPSQPLDRTRAAAAMQESLAVPGAEITIKDAISGRVPAGQIEFPLSGLGMPSPTGPSAPVLWRGDVVYGDSHRFAIWARVEIAAPCQRLTAAESLKAGRPIEARQIRATTATCFPVAGKELPAVAQLTGMSPIHSIAAGSELRLELLAPPNEINRGDAVHIEVRSGAARLLLTARALNGGRSGDTISVRNPESNKTFQARVTGKGTAVVEAGIPKGI
jgi:flagella basal body P-ring formation protein FlgA